MNPSFYVTNDDNMMNFAQADSTGSTCLFEPSEPSAELRLVRWHLFGELQVLSQQRFAGLDDESGLRTSRAEWTLRGLLRFLIGPQRRDATRRDSV